MDNQLPLENLTSKEFLDLKIMASPSDYSAIRNKNVLISPTEEQFELLKKRLQDRINDSRGETIYDIGIGEGKKMKREINSIVNSCKSFN